MSRDINWEAEDEEGNHYDVRAVFFAGKFQIQFLDEGSETWDYKRRPSMQDLETLLEHVKRRYQRRTATHKQLLLTELMIKDHRHKYPALPKAKD